MIKAKELLAQFTVEEHGELAEHYFKQNIDAEYLQGKPFVDFNETIELMHCFAEVLMGLQLVKGLKILDFGAGTCWVSKLLTQMGFEMTSLDISSSALLLGQKIYAGFPFVGKLLPHYFSHFNGRKIDNADETFDRIICMDAFHHVPNTEEVLTEMSRVLKRGGIIGFSEPGPTHSEQIGSQVEMERFKVLEQDIDIHTIEQEAKRAGLGNMRVAVLNIFPCHFSPREFDNFCAGESKEAVEKYYKITQDYIWRRRIFFLTKI